MCTCVRMIVSDSVSGGFGGGLKVWPKMQSGRNQACNDGRYKVMVGALGSCFTSHLEPQCVCACVCG